MTSGPRPTGSADGPGARDLLVRMHGLAPGSPERRRLREQIIESHMPLVVHLAKRFSGRSEPLSDLIQVGAVGLIKAVDRFDPDRQLEFSTFATPTILGEIKRHFRDTGWLVHVPRRAQELQTALNRARAELSQQLGRPPTVAEISASIDVDPERVVEALDVARAYAGVPLEALAQPGEAAPEHPALGIVDEEYERVEQRALLRGAISALPEAEREVLLLRFVTGRTQTEIAALIGVSQMQVSRLVARGLTRLRERLDPPAADPDGVSG